MASLSVAVLGGGPAGLAAALALGRVGHRVTLIERDEVVAGASATDSVNWPRRGIPHFLQAHSFTSLGRLELKQLFPDVFQALIDNGADDIDLLRKLRGPRQPGDDDVKLLGVRRPVIEWALRRAVLAEPTVTVQSGVTVVGLESTMGELPLVSGVLTTAGKVGADVVVDAMGRRSPVRGWIKATGGTPMAEESSDCGVLYYTRYYRVREGASLPDGPWIPTPRGDLGYGQFSTFPGDNGAFAGLIAIPPGDAHLKVLRHAKAFDAAAAAIPGLHAWTNLDVAEPTTDVLPMGSLQNTLRSMVNGRPSALGLISIGDAVFHTDPVFALGLSYALMDARALAGALDGHGRDLEAVALAFDAATRGTMESRFRNAAAVDSLRLRRWMGEPIDIAHRDGGAYPLFAIVAGGAGSLVDDEVMRVTLRRNYSLDPLSTLDDNVELQLRMERILADLMATPRPPAGPPRDELLALMQAATVG